MSRSRTRLLLATAAAAVGAVVLVAVLGGGDDGPRRAIPVRGVAIDMLPTEPPTAELQDVDTAARLGANTLRVALLWSLLEPARRGDRAPDYLRRLDALVARASTRGIRVLLTPVVTPCWAAQGGGPAACADAATAATLATRPPADPGAYAELVAFLAKRYREDLAGIEIWNEPNLPSFWSSATPVEDYVKLLRAAHAAIKDATPEVPVVAGALAGADYTTLAKLYAAGFAGFFDVLSLHPYNDGRSPTKRLTRQRTGATFLQGLRAVRRVLRRHREKRPVWLTEFGWNTSTLRGSPFGDGVTPAQQAEYLAKAIDMLRDPRWGIDLADGVFIYRLRDIGTNPADPQHNYGLLRQDRTPKPAFDAVRKAFAAGATAR